MSKYLALAFAIGAVAFGIGFFADRATQGEEPAHARVDEPSVPVPTPRAAHSASAIDGSHQRAPQRPKPLAAPSSELQKQFAASTDWRAFALEAMRKPERGGVMYARHASLLCSRDMAAIASLATGAQNSTVAKLGTVSSEQLAAKEKLVSLCSSFAQGEAASLARDLAKSPALENDPLMRATSKVREALKSRDAVRIRTATEELVKTGDPIALGEGELLLYLMRANRDGSLWFDGVNYAGNDASRQAELTYAIQLATCQKASRCVLDDEMTIKCAMQGECAADKESYIRRLARDNGLNDKAIADLASHVRSKLDSRDSDAFLPPR